MSVSATVEVPRTTLEPGGAASVSLTVSNDGDLVDEYRFRVVGSLARWASVEPESVSVYPGSSTTVTLLFRVPRSWEVPAGEAPFGVQVLPAQHPHDTVVVEGVVEVLPFWESSAELVPLTSEGRAGGRHRVAVDNRGNTTLEVQLEAKDPEERLQLVPGPATMRIAPGTVQSADLRVHPRRRVWRGTQQAHPFTVEVRPDRGPRSVLAGTHRQDPMLPRWSLKAGVVGIVLALLAALAVVTVPVVGGALGTAAGFLRECRDGVLAGDAAVCLGAAPRQEQEAREPDAQEQEAREQEAREQEAREQEAREQEAQDQGGAQEEVSEELRARAAPEETDQDVFTAEDDLVFTRLVLISSDGDTGVFRLSLDGTPISEDLALEQFSGREQAFEVVIRMSAGQELALELLCSSADAELLELTDVCEVTAGLEGVVERPGG
ncbi:hypothetical protein ACH9EU_09445 [Kocuria sp. M1R5S2]|uniref:hypothetical protein n=1 Tax=Kocuria rhizosphaerae TaxID=3376285 RepID=UPI0037AD6457